MATQIVVQVENANPTNTTGYYKHGLCGCFDNCSVCLITYFCPCYTAGKIAEAVGESCILHSCLFICCPLISLFCMCLNRGKVRSQRNIPGSSVGDFCVYWCCMSCALCQDAQETNALGGSGMAEQAMARE